MFPSVFIFFMLLVLPITSGQLSSSERRILFRIQYLLEYPPALQGWANWTSFCDLPASESLTIKCSGNHVTEFSVIGNKSSSLSSIRPKPTQQSFHVSEQTLSESFSIDTFVTVVTKLSSLKVLSLVSLGMWGSLPPKIKRLNNLQVLNVSSNFIYGEIPSEIGRMQSLQSLVLSGNIFKGAVPDLSVLPVLEELNVGGNFLGPRIPALGNKLVTLILKNNLFRSGIPPELRNCDQLQVVDFSNNNILGIIPSALFSLPSLQYINLAGNGLMGTISRNTSCSSELKFVDVSDNHLVGDLPSCISYNSSMRVVLYTGNCLSTGDLKNQRPDSFCQEKALAVKPPTEISKKHSTGKLGLVLGIIGAILGGITLLGVIALVAYRKLGKQVSENKMSKDTVAGKSPKLVTDARHGSTAMMFGALGLPQYHVFSLEEIEEATNNFDASNLIGEGSQGQLYKGWLRDGSAAVIRCLKLKQRQSSNAIGRQIEVLSKLRHEHLVSVLGHHLATPQDHPTASSMYLVFEYVSNGTLRDHLNDLSRRKMLKWPQRMAVSIGVARGIQFLHSGVTPGLFGNNLKTENIFLDENLKAKISNYKLPLSHMGGIENSLNGEQTHDHRNSAEHGARGDVYQLGIILLELVTGKHITSQSQVDFERIQLEQGLADTPSELVELADPSIRDSAAYDSLRTTVEVTMNCLSRDSKRRPSIEDVLWNLQYSVQVQDGWTPSGESFGAQSSQS